MLIFLIKMQRLCNGLKINSDKNSQIFSDEYGNKKITSLINQKSTLYQKSLVELSEQSILEGLYFFN